MTQLCIDAIISGSKKPILCIAVFDAGSSYTYATSSEDGSVKIWSSSHHRVVHGFLPTCFPEPVTALAWKNGTSLYAASGASLTLLSLNLGSLDAPFITREAGETWVVAQDEINDMHLLGKNQLVLADDAGRVSLFHTDSAHVSTLSPSVEHAQMCTSVTSVVASEGETCIVSAGLDARIKIWSIGKNTRHKKDKSKQNQSTGSNERNKSMHSQSTRSTGTNKSTGSSEKSTESARLLQEIDVAAERRADENALQIINPPYVHALLATLKNRHLVAGCGDGSILLLARKKSGKRRGEWIVHATQAHGAAIGAMTVVMHATSDEEADYLLTGSNDKTCKLWRVSLLEKPAAAAAAATGDAGAGAGAGARAAPEAESSVPCEASIQVPGKINAMATLPDGKVILGDVLGNLIFLSIQ